MTSSKKIFSERFKLISFLQYNILSIFTVLSDNCSAGMLCFVPSEPKVNFRAKGTIYRLFFRASEHVQLNEHVVH